MSDSPLLRRSALLAAAFATVATSAALIAQQPTATPAPPTEKGGSILYSENCSGCHGAGDGGGRAPNLFAPVLLGARTDEQLATTIHDGIAGSEMPSFKDILSDSERFRIVNYLRLQSATLKGKPRFVPDPANQVIRSQKQTFRIDVVAAGLETP